MSKKIILSLAFLAMSLGINLAQDCGTLITPEESEELEQMLGKNAMLRSGNSNVISNALVNIPIKFHVFRRSDGSGGISQNQANNLLVQVNDFFIQSNMRFIQEGDINFIDDDEVFDFNADNEGDATIGNSVSKVVNVYLFNSIRAGGRPLCGYTRFPPSSDRVFAVYSCVLNGATTLEHELGHYFTLYHTHGTTNTGTTDELVNQSNCPTAGDRLCDTPADPNLSGQVDSNCAYIGGATDANGDIYKPDPSNIMSYAPEQCAEKFSVGQYDRIRAGFENGRGYLNYTSDSFLATFEADLREVCVGESARFSLNSFGATSYEWEFEGGEPASSSLESPEVLYSSAGTYNVVLTVFNNAGQSFTVERNSYVRVSDPSLTAIDESLVSTFASESELLSDYKIANSDNSLTFEQTNLTLDGSVEGAVYVNNYNYITESLPQVDQLSTFSFDNRGIKKYTVEFDYAYNYRSTGTGLDSQIITDSLDLQVGNECENIYTSIFKRGGAQLATADVVTGEEFFPESTNEFRKVQIEYTPSENLDFLLFRFSNISFNGNNLFIKGIKVIPDFSVDNPSNFRFIRVENDSLIFRWIDNSSNETGFVLEASEDGVAFNSSFEIPSGSQIAGLPTDAVGDLRFFRLKAVGVKGFESDYSDIVQIDDVVLSVAEAFANGMHLFPNPVVNNLTVDLDEALLNDGISYQILSMSGEVLQQGMFTSAKNYIDFSHFNPGMIIVQIYNENNRIQVTKKIIKL